MVRLDLTDGLVALRARGGGGAVLSHLLTGKTWGQMLRTFCESKEEVGNAE